MAAAAKRATVTSLEVYSRSAGLLPAETVRAAAAEPGWVARAVASFPPFKHSHSQLLRIQGKLLPLDDVPALNALLSDALSAVPGAESPVIMAASR